MEAPPAIAEQLSLALPPILRLESPYPQPAPNAGCGALTRHPICNYRIDEDNPLGHQQAGDFVTADGCTQPHACQI